MGDSEACLPECVEGVATTRGREDASGADPETLRSRRRSYAARNTDGRGRRGLDSGERAFKTSAADHANSRNAYRRVGGGTGASNARARFVEPPTHRRGSAAPAASEAAPSARRAIMCRHTSPPLRPNGHRGTPPTRRPPSARSRSASGRQLQLQLRLILGFQHAQD
jgi:hypothetical protein